MLTVRENIKGKLFTIENELSQFRKKAEAANF
jgi:hypothetical protein